MRGFLQESASPQAKEAREMLYVIEKEAKEGDAESVRGMPEEKG